MKQNFQYSVETNFLKNEELTPLVSEFNRAFDEMNANKISDNIVQLNSSEITEIGILRAIHKKIEAHFTDILGVSSISLAKVWLVKSQPKDTDPHKLPCLPHFDKHRYVKAMVYLHDVDKSHGPIHFGRLITPSRIDSRRKSLPTNYKELGLNTIQKSDLETDMEPILGKGGDVVFFDTNAAHSAGIVSEGFERRVIRFDFDLRGVDSSLSLFNRILHFICSRTSCRRVNSASTT